MTWYWRLVRLSVGVLVMSAQLVELKSEFCWATKSIEGTTQESRILVPEGAMLRVGAGVERRVKTPQPEDAISRLPSAEPVKAGGLVTGAASWPPYQVDPK